MIRLLTLVSALSVAVFYSVAQEKLNYELWLDQLYMVRDRGVIEGGVKDLSISLDMIPYGMHSVSFRIQSADGTWSAPATKYFVHTQETTAANFEYWVDGMQALAQKGKLDGTEKLFELSLSLIPAGFHSISFRVQDNNGNWGAPAVLYFFNGEEVQFSYDGRYLSMTTTVPDAEINYRKVTTGDADDGEVKAYDGTPFDVEGLGTFKAWTGDIGSLESTSESIFDVNGYGAEDRATVALPGLLGSCYDWNGGQIPARHFSVEGTLDASDYEWLGGRDNVTHLDLTDVTDGTIPAGALACGYLQSLALPSGIKEISGNIFKSRHNLCALRWTSPNPVPEGMLDSLTNPNMLLYVDDASMAADVAGHTHNLVASGVAESLELHDGHRFYCPEAFTAREASFLRYFDKETGIDGECAGWETIILPFDVRTVSHVKGDLTPFGVNPEEEQLRYWLYAPAASGWERATSITANEPYLIAMPNNEAYYNPFNVGGNVTFRATDAVIAATPDDLGRDFTEGRMLVGTYTGVAPSPEFLGVNQETADVAGASYRPGSVFVSLYDESVSPASPFEAYVDAGQKLRKMDIFKTSEVETLMADMEMQVWTENGGICIQAGFSARVDIFDTTGRLVAVANVKAGEISRVDGLAPGIYIVGRNKVLIPV